MLQKKHRSKKSHRQPVEMGTQNTDVDYDWIPKETLERDLSKYRNFVFPVELQETLLISCVISVLNLVGKIDGNLRFEIFPMHLFIKHCNISSDIWCNLVYTTRILCKNWQKQKSWLVSQHNLKKKMFQS